MELTNKIIESGKSSNGGWSKAQLELFGVSWPFPKGWKSEIIGKNVPIHIVAEFIALKDVHLTELADSKIKEKAQKFLFHFGKPPSEEFRTECPFDLPGDEFYRNGMALTDPDEILDFVLGEPMNDAREGIVRFQPMSDDEFFYHAQDTLF